MRRGRTWPWIRMRPFLARFSEPVWSGHLASWADFITTTAELEFSVHTAPNPERRSTCTSIGVIRFAQGNRPVAEKLVELSRIVHIEPDLILPLESRRILSTWLLATCAAYQVPEICKPLILWAHPTRFERGAFAWRGRSVAGAAG